MTSFLIRTVCYPTSGAERQIGQIGQPKKRADCPTGGVARPYLVDLNATKAAIRAGYSERTAKSQGQRLLTNVDIAAAIEKAQEARSERTEITQDWVIANLKSVAERCMQAQAGRLNRRHGRSQQPRRRPLRSAVTPTVQTVQLKRGRNSSNRWPKLRLSAGRARTWLREHWRSIRPPRIHGLRGLWRRRSPVPHKETHRAKQAMGAINGH